MCALFEAKPLGALLVQIRFDDKSAGCLGVLVVAARRVRVVVLLDVSETV